jgi:hypothetical protein
LKPITHASRRGGRRRVIETIDRPADPWRNQAVFDIGAGFVALALALIAGAAASPEKSHIHYNADYWWW